MTEYLLLYSCLIIHLSRVITLVLFQRIIKQDFKSKYLVTRDWSRSMTVFMSFIRILEERQKNEKIEEDVGKIKRQYRNKKKY